MPVQELDVWLGNHRLLTLRQQHKIKKTTISMLHSSLSIVYLMKQQEKIITNEKKQDTFIEYLSHADTVQDLHWPWVQCVKLHLIFVNPKAWKTDNNNKKESYILINAINTFMKSQKYLSLHHMTQTKVLKDTKSNAMLFDHMWYINTIVQANRFCGLLAVIQQCN